MNQEALATMREMLRVTPLAQLLFRGEVVLAFSQEVKRFFPDIIEGLSATQLFGEDVNSFRRFTGEGSLLFPVYQPTVRCDVTLTPCEGFKLATVCPLSENYGADIAQSIAGQLGETIASMWASVPGLLDRLEEATDQKTRGRMAILNQGMYQLLRLQRNLQSYCEPEARLWTEEYINLAAELRRFADEIAPLVAEAGRTMTARITSAYCSCRVDMEHLRWALMNLISNAIKFSEPGSEISLELRKTPKWIHLTLRDQGCGIPADQMSGVFRRMERRNGVPDPRWGAGLGLPIAKRIVEMNNGLLLLESVEGKGTTVHISFEEEMPRRLELHAPRMHVRAMSGFNLPLAALSEELPLTSFDPRNTDG